MLSVGVLVLVLVTVMSMISLLFDTQLTLTGNSKLTSKWYHAKETSYVEATYV